MTKEIKKELSSKNGCVSLADENTGCSVHTKESLMNDLINAGIQPSDTLLVHSSMKSIGMVAGGADAVLDVLTDYFKEKGLLVFPTLTYSLNASNPVFYVNKTPSQVGLLSDMFWRRPGVLRSLHPTHSVAAWGHDAAEFIAGHEIFDTPCAEGSPWGRLADRRAKILFIGTKTICCNTFLHGVEEWFGVPGMLTEAKERLLSIDADGIEHVVPSRRHIGSHSNYYGKMQSLFEHRGILRHVRFGDAACFLLESAMAKEIVMECLKADSQLFTHE